jgi:hypothetical protein
MMYRETNTLPCDSRTKTQQEAQYWYNITMTGHWRNRSLRQKIINTTYLSLSLRERARVAARKRGRLNVHARV